MSVVVDKYQNDGHQINYLFQKTEGLFSNLPFQFFPKERTANTKYRIFPSKNHAKPK
jgi:hypothetical protein